MHSTIPTNFADAQAANLVSAMDKIIDASDRAFVEEARVKVARMLARDERLAAIARKGQWHLVCAKCQNLAPSLTDGWCDPCRGFSYDDEILAQIDGD